MRAIFGGISTFRSRIFHVSDRAVLNNLSVRIIGVTDDEMFADIALGDRDLMNTQVQEGGGEEGILLSLFA